jgi:hypothetical protein
MTENAETKLNCESCGEEFSCGAKTGLCWCFEIELESEMLAELRQVYKNCLCKDCLMKITENSTAKTKDKTNNAFLNS